MSNALSIRSYSRSKNSHSHEHHQLVLPLRGVIDIEVDTFKGKVRPRECVIVKAGELHYFASEAEARFVVVDLDVLPEPLKSSEILVFSITPPLFELLSFIEAQLEYQVNESIQALAFDTLYQLLSEQQLLKQIDQRVRNSLEYIEANLAEQLSISTLANIACLSPTQFKKSFKEQTNQTVTQYITKLRMEKAQALLLHTDYPMQIIAEAVGYTDSTAFSRRFSQYFGLAPSKFKR